MTDARKCYNFKSSVLTPQGIECYKIPETNSFLVTRAPKDTTRFTTYALKIEECDITLAGIQFTAICMLLGDTLIGIERQLASCSICRSSLSARRIRHEMPIYRAALIRWLRNHGINYTIGAARARGTLVSVIDDLGYDPSTVHNIDIGQDRANDTLPLTEAATYGKHQVWFYKARTDDIGDRIGTWYTLVVDKEHWHQKVEHLPLGPYVETDKDYMLWCLSNAHTASPHEMPTSEFMGLLRKFDKLWLTGGIECPHNFFTVQMFIMIVHKMLNADGGGLDVSRIREIIRDDESLLEHTRGADYTYDKNLNKYPIVAGKLRFTNGKYGSILPPNEYEEGVWVYCPPTKYQEVLNLLHPARSSDDTQFTSDK